MSRWHNSNMWDHRAVRRLDPAGKYVAGRIREMADKWGLVRLDVELIADTCDVDDELVESVLDTLTSGRRPWLHQYVGSDGRSYAAIHGWDEGSSRTFLRDRGAPEVPEPPHEVMAAAGCSWISRANRDGDVPDMPAQATGIRRIPEPPEPQDMSSSSGTAGERRQSHLDAGKPSPVPAGAGDSGKIGIHTTRHDVPPTGVRSGVEDLDARARRSAPWGAPPPAPGAEEAPGLAAQPEPAASPPEMDPEERAVASATLRVLREPDSPAKLAQLEKLGERSVYAAEKAAELRVALDLAEAEQAAQAEAMARKKAEMRAQLEAMAAREAIGGAA